jgi:hypothetical protein
MADAQAPVVSDSKSPTLESWSLFFPLLAGCDANMSVILDDQHGRISQTAEYRKSQKANDGEIVVVSEPWVNPDECGYVSIEMTVPYTPPVRMLSKQEQKAEKKLARRIKKSQKQLEKIYELSKHMYPSAPPPYAFNIKGFEALQYFSPPSDCIGCEDLRFITVSVKFATDKTLTAHLIGNLETVKQIIEKTDFEKLNTAMNMYADSHKKPVTK